MEICDRVGTEANGPKDCMRAIVRRLNHSLPTVVMQSLTVSHISIIAKFVVIIKQNITKLILFYLFLIIIRIVIGRLCL